MNKDERKKLDEIIEKNNVQDNTKIQTLKHSKLIDSCRTNTEC